MMVGLFEPEAAAWNVNRIPAISSFVTLPPDLERMAPFVEKAFSRYAVGAAFLGAALGACLSLIHAFAVGAYH